jgi:hypothetical protein
LSYCCNYAWRWGQFIKFIIQPPTVSFILSPNVNFSHQSSNAFSLCSFLFISENNFLTHRELQAKLYIYVYINFYVFPW